MYIQKIEQLNRFISWYFLVLEQTLNKATALWLVFE
jgi:hypothetical protein